MTENLKLSSTKTYPKRKNAKPGTVDLMPQEFENLIEDQGIRVRVTAAAVCPNRTEIEDTNHALDCPICFGSQVLDMPETCYEDWAFVQSVTLDKKMDVQGIWDMKDARITFKQGVRVSYWYKVEILDFASVFNEVIKRKSGNVDKLRYEAAKMCDTPYYLVDKLGNRYALNENYRIDGRDLVWITPSRPAVGTLYTLLYPILPTFRVLELMHENRYYYRSSKRAAKEPLQLPQQAHLRLDYLANKAGANILVGE